ncbi:MAG: aldo/keto reductase [Christensenellales bacterium]|jgi:aryl-alcohol dehydrogenase-like predicted oxidoreductase
MRYQPLGNTGIEVSSVVYGGIINMDETQQQADRFVSQAIEAGVNYFDVAPTYGDAEEKLGPALAPYRKDVFLACKTEQRNAQHARTHLETSLRKLKTDYFDVYQLHALTTDEDIDLAFGSGGVMETVLKAKRDGTIRNIGFSAHSEDVALRALEMHDFDTVLFPMNWALGINRGWGDRISEVIREKGIGLLGMKALVRRKWREGEERRYPKSWCQPIWGDEALGVAAMKYAVAKGAHTLVPPGNIEHFQFMVDHANHVFSEPMTDAEWAMLRREAKAAENEMIF